MAKTLDVLKDVRQQMIINLHTSGDSAAVASYLKNSAWTGEIAVQHLPFTSADDARASLWTLANDNETAIEFVDKKGIEELIVSGASFMIASAVPSSVNVREEWKLIKEGSSAACGDTIKIYKDSSLYKVELGKSGDTVNEDTGVITHVATGDTCLNFVYQLQSGKYSLVQINIEEFLSEQEFKSGVTATNHIVHGVVAAKGDPYLYVDGDGFFLSGLSDAVSVVSGASEGHVIVTSAKPADQIIYTVLGQDIASESALTALSAWTMQFVGSGFVGSSITETIVEDELVTAAALCDLDERIRAISGGSVVDKLNFVDSAKTNYYVNAVNEASGIVSTTRVQLPVVAVENAHDTLADGSANVVIAVDSASTVTVDFKHMVIDCGSF